MEGAIKFGINDISLDKDVEAKLFTDGDGHDDNMHAEDVHIENDKEWTQEEEIGHVINEETASEKKAAEEKLDKTFDEKSGLNSKGFDKDGLNKDGLDVDGFNKDGALADGRKKEDFTEGYDKEGLNTLGYNKDGFDKDGINKDGFDKDDKSADGRESKDFTDGYDKDGFDVFGFNSEGKDKEGKLKTDKPSEENPEGQPSSDGEPLVVKSILDGTQKLELTDEDGQKVALKDIIENHRNKKKWEASNTQKAQEQAKAKDEHDLAVKDFADKLKFSDEQIKAISEEEFLKDADAYFDEKGQEPKKNPLREILKTVNENSVSQTKRDEAAQTKATEDKTEADKTIFSLKLRAWQKAGTLRLSVQRKVAGTLETLDAVNTIFPVLASKGFSDVTKIEGDDGEHYEVGKIQFDQAGIAS